MATKLHLQDKAERRLRRRHKIQVTVRGTTERPRLVIFRSNASIYAQLIDDSKGFTIVSSSSRSIDAKGNKTDSSKLTGKAIADLAKEKGISSVVFDRNGYLYHGRVKALADGAREGGLKF
ncbi:MAG: 50S ribosomal protein L18 [Ignavibacteriota bacterium]